MVNANGVMTMTDVLKIALDRRAELHEEVARLDDFIRMAETLIRASQARRSDEGIPGAQVVEQRAAPVERPAPVTSDENSVRTAIRRAEVGGLSMSAEVSRPSVIRRGQAKG